jgi:hypothetical protein
MRDVSRFWFPAKRQGWGWGPPLRWQGWAVLALNLSIEAWAAMRFLPRSPGSFVVVTVLAVLMLLAVCLMKGEPPSWRWGDDR